MAATFPGIESIPAPDTGLIVKSNLIPVQQDARIGNPFTIGNIRYYRGLFCHAYSEVIVRLPASAQSFDAVVGVDSNGSGSVVFVVKRGKDELFRSDIVKKGQEGSPIKVDLNGAKEFTLIVEDGGDGVGFDQAVWADAKVTLQDGQILWLGDFPIIGGQPTITYAQQLPFSFIYNGRPSAELLSGWTNNIDRQQLDENRAQTTLIYTDPTTRLEVRCVLITYRDFPTVEWTLYFKNTGSADTPILENIQALDTAFQRYVYDTSSSWGEFTLHYNKGEYASVESFQPLTNVLAADTKLQLAPEGGRGTQVQMPFYNLSYHSEGIICVLGWPGQWAAEFIRDSQAGLTVRGGQQLTHLKLLPGEEIRTPLVVLQFYKGQWRRAQNIWRRWMLAHNVPRVEGELPQPIMSVYAGRIYSEMVNADEQKLKDYMDRYIEVGLKPDYLWVDAGWYVNAHEKDWPFTGTWEVDTNRFPGGLRPLSDYARSKGVKFLLWFEPERVHADTWLADEHPDWVLKLEGDWRSLLDLGNPQAWQWAVNHFSDFITTQGIDYYRQDFNIDPLNFWRNNDAPDRQGVTENKHVMGYLSFWDELLRHHPHLRIDSCASGGRRNDLETLRRSVPLWRTDYAHSAIVQQCQTYGISEWIPYYGTGNLACEGSYYGSGPTPVVPYAFWSNISPSLMVGLDVRVQDMDYPQLQKLFAYWRKIIPNYYGDYYPLSSHSTKSDAWMAWQFNRPEIGQGLVQAFVRPDAPILGLRVKLQDLTPDAVYEISRYNTDEKTTQTGQDLMQNGLKIYTDASPEAAVITYKKIP
ncbi:MAG: alpha-galactosidase [Sedimentisphaerales bacterium]|nr:alpha-galactosidase [Sedimentisphaerales bacterium]